TSTNSSTMISSDFNERRGYKRSNQVLGEVNSNVTNKKCCLMNQNQINIISEINERKRSRKRKQSVKSLKSKLKNAKKDFLHELTPSSSVGNAQTNSTNTPLPNLDFANATEVWNLMLKNDDQYRRDPDLFARHSSLQPIMRATLLDWLNEVCQAYNLTRQTYYLALDFFDRYLSLKDDVSKRRLQLLGITCLFIASKIEEIFPPKLSRFSFVCDGACDDSEILTKELVILNTLKWELHPITPIAWLNAFFKVFTYSEKENISSKRPVNESFLIPNYDSQMFVQIAHLIDLCTLDAGSLSFSYSVIAASAFYHFTNETIVSQCTGKTMQELQPCIEWMVPFAIAIKNAGFDFLDSFENNKAMIQIHTISLDILHNAQSIQADIESASITVLDSDNSSITLTPSKMLLTPPRSAGMF
ncbi:G1/S-specific cyclin-E1, partial [Sarcoptes scabiei]